MRLLVLRPEPGATETAARAAALQLSPLVSPLFTVEPLAWDPPHPGEFDALLLTSANAARHGGPLLRRYGRLPGYAVGAATAAAMRGAGLRVDGTGEGDAASILRLAARAGRQRVLHLCGAEHRSVEDDVVKVTRILVYASRPHEALVEDAIAAARAGAVALLHSPRAASLWSRLIDEAGIDRSRVHLVAISPAAAEAAGSGWAGVSAAPTPTDAAMLAIARGLCQNARR